MNQKLPSTALVATFGLTVALSACAGRSSMQTAPQPSGGEVTGEIGGEIGSGPAGKNYPGRYPFVKADVDFMTGMIAHHAQAVAMAKWAPTHGASEPVRLLCERIVVGQSDEIGLMQVWLRDRKQPVPSATSQRMHMKMNGQEMDMLMPGMLTDEQMAELDKARGKDFDRLFLTGMIQHHYGAINMVDELFGSNGAAQDEVVFKFAGDVWADQSTEIDRMQKMLTPPQGNPR